MVVHSHILLVNLEKFSLKAIFLLIDLAEIIFHEFLDVYVLITCALRRAWRLLSILGIHSLATASTRTSNLRVLSFNAVKPFLLFFGEPCILLFAKDNWTRRGGWDILDLSLGGGTRNFRNARL